VTAIFIYLMDKGLIMGKTLNEITGPRVFVVDNPRTKKLHITGGYGQPDMKRTLCGQKVNTPTVLDPRDTAARDGYQDYTKWCVKCMGLLDFEALDQIILFAAIEWPTGTNGQLSVVPHLSRKRPKLKLTPPPANPTTYKVTDVASPTPIITSRVRKPVGGTIIAAPAKKKRKTRSDKGVKRGPRKKPEIMPAPQPQPEVVIENLEEGLDV